MKRYFVLVLIIILLTGIDVFAYFNSTNADLKSFLMNLCTEIIGAGLAYFIFDQIISLREKKNNKRRSEIATSQINKVILRYIQLLTQMYKASSKEKNTSTINNCSTLFNDNFYVNIKYFNITAEAPVLTDMRFINGKWVTTKPNWLQYLIVEFSKNDSQLDIELSKYAEFIDSEQLGILMQIANSKPSEMVKTFAKILQMAQNTAIDFRTTPQFIPFFPTADYSIKELVNGIINYDIYLNNNYEKNYHLVIDGAFWSVNVTPLIGDSRLNENLI